MTTLANVSAPTRPWVDVVHGRRQLMAIADELEAFGRQFGAPVSARPAWTHAALHAVGTTEPIAVLVRDESYALLAAVVLLVVPGPGTDTIVAPGGLEHRAAVLVRDASAATALGEALADVLMRRPRSTLLRLGPLPVDSPALAGLASALPGAATITVDPIPVVRRTSASAAEDYLSHGMRRGLRRGSRRLGADGRTAAVTFTTDGAEVLALAPLMEQACRDRDHAHGRISPLDDEIGRALWQQRLQLLVAADMVELAALRLDGELASYVLGVLDGTTYRVLEGRFVSQFARYSPGRLLEAAVLQRMLDDPTLDTLDWMTAVAADTLLATNASDPMVVVQAELRGGGAAASRSVRAGRRARRPMVA